MVLNFYYVSSSLIAIIIMVKYQGIYKIEDCNLETLHVCVCVCMWTCGVSVGYAYLPQENLDFAHCSTYINFGAILTI